MTQVITAIIIPIKIGMRTLIAQPNFLRKLLTASMMSLLRTVPRPDQIRIEDPGPDLPVGSRNDRAELRDGTAAAAGRIRLQDRLRTGR